MPNSRAQRLAHLKEVWPVKDQIAELRGKLQLKERDQKTVIESQRQIVLQNEDEIVNNRKTNEVNRVLLASSILGDNQMLYNILHNRRAGNLDIQKKSAPNLLPGVIFRFVYTVFAGRRYFPSDAYHQEPSS